MNTDLIVQIVLNKLEQEAKERLGEDADAFVEALGRILEAGAHLAIKEALTTRMEADELVFEDKT